MAVLNPGVGLTRLVSLISLGFLILTLGSSLSLLLLPFTTINFRLTPPLVSLVKDLPVGFSCYACVCLWISLPAVRSGPCLAFGSLSIQLSGVPASLPVLRPVRVPRLT